MVSETFNFRHLSPKEVTHCSTKGGDWRKSLPETLRIAKFKCSIKTLAQGTTSLADERTPQASESTFALRYPRRAIRLRTGKRQMGTSLWSYIMSSYWKGDEGYGSRQKRGEKKQKEIIGPRVER